MNIKQLRTRLGLRTVDVASYVNIAESTVRNWEYGKTIPKLRLDQLKKLLELYQCSFDELYYALENSSELNKKHL
jgi:DNA-binding transcriptional regulator YiaG